MNRTERGPHDLLSSFWGFVALGVWLAATYWALSQQASWGAAAFVAATACSFTAVLAGYWTGRAAERD